MYKIKNTELTLNSVFPFTHKIFYSAKVLKIIEKSMAFNKKPTYCESMTGVKQEFSILIYL